jgi:hypothetical protein
VAHTISSIIYSRLGAVETPVNSRHQEKRSHSGSLGNNYARPVQNLSGLAASQDLHRRRPLRGRLIVLALRAPSFGQLLCPSYLCIPFSLLTQSVTFPTPSFATLTSVVRVTPLLAFVGHSMQTYSVHPLPHICPPPAGARQPVCLILPPLSSGTTTKVVRRVAARRPPSSASPAQHCRAHGGRVAGRRLGNKQPRRSAREYSWALGSPWRSRPNL